MNTIVLRHDNLRLKSISFDSDGLVPIGIFYIVPPKEIMPGYIYYEEVKILLDDLIGVDAYEI